MANIKQKTKYILLAAIMLLTTLLFAACSERQSEEKLRAEGYIRVLFDCQGGELEARPEYQYFTLPNSKVLMPGKTPVLLQAPVRTGYALKGWYRGEIIGGELVTGQAWDFDTDRIGSEDMVLYAVWVRDMTVYYRDAADNSVVATASVSYDKNWTLPLVGPTVSGKTWLGGYYASAEDALAGNALSSNYSVLHDGTIFEMNIYTNWLNGVYTLVRTAADMSNISQYISYYLLNDITFDDEIRWAMPMIYSGEIIGNGHKIIGATVDMYYSLRTGRNFGLFGEISGAKLENVEFVNCKVALKSVDQSATLSAGMLAGRISSGSTFDNVVIGGELVLEFYSGQITYGQISGYTAEGINLSGITVTQYNPQITLLT